MSNPSVAKELERVLVDKKSQSEYSSKERKEKSEQILQKFYQELENEYAALPLTEEEIRQQFSAEHLLSLSLREYVELMRRVPPRFFTHVTRQGIRDHASHHGAGVGEWHDGFNAILQSGRLESVLEQALTDTVTKDTVRTVLDRFDMNPEKYSTREGFLHNVDRFLTTSSVAPASSMYADRKALHAALESVADEYYGGERDNEIFMIYPVAYVANAYHIGTQRLRIPEGYNPDEQYRTSQFNDFWLLSAQENEGALPLDASIVFLPGNTPVDPETGSKYRTDKEKRPVANREQIARLEQVLSQVPSTHLNAVIELRSAQVRLRETQKERADTERQFVSSFQQENWEREQQRYSDVLAASTPIMNDLTKRLREAGVDDPRIMNALLESGELYDVKKLFDVYERRHSRAKTDDADEDSDAFDLDRIYRDLGFAYAPPERTVQAKDYWESHFARTGKRPSKVVYYSDMTPSQAVDTFKAQAGLTRETSTVNLKKLFEDRDIGQHGIHKTLEREREIFYAFAEQIADERFPTEDSPPTHRAIPRETEQRV